MEDKFIKDKTDPTPLTTSQLLREIGSLKELVFTEIVAVKEGIKIAHEDLVRVPTDVQRQVGSLRELLETKIIDSDNLKEEKFRNIDKRLDLVEQARIEQKKDTATAVDAALKAAKEAVTEQNTSNVLAINKSETSTTKQIDNQDSKINDIKDRLIRLEALVVSFTTTVADVKTLSGISSESKGRNAGVNWVIGVLIAVAGIAGTVIGFVIKSK